MTAQFARAPHVGRSATTLNEPHAALLIDFDNVTMGIRSDLSKELKTLLNSDIIKGKVAVQRAYADWRRYPQYIVPLAESSVDLIYAPAYGSQKKNATDIRLAIDALELVFTRPEIGTYILLSGDSDFSSLVLKLKEYGKYVVGVGIRESASDLLVQNCDEYYSYSALSGLKRASEDSSATTYDVWELVEMAVQRMVSDGDVMRSDRLKQVLVKLDPNFDEKTLGFSKYNRFLQEAAKRGAIRLQKLENGQYEVAPPAAEAASPEPEEALAAPATPSARESRDDGRRRGRRGRGRRDTEPQQPAVTAAGDGAPAAPPAEPVATEARPERAEQRAEVTGELAEAFDLLRRAVRDVAEESNGSARDSDVKRRMLELRPDWDEAQYGFSKFSRFLRHAHDAEVVSLDRLDNGNYEVKIAADGAAHESAAVEPEKVAPRGKRAGKGEREPKGREKRAARGAREEKPEPAAAAASTAEPARTEKEAKPAPAAELAEPAQSRAAKPQAAQAQAGQAQAQPQAGQRAPASGPVLGIRRGSRGGKAGPQGPPPLLAGQAVRPVGAVTAAATGAAAVAQQQAQGAGERQAPGSAQRRAPGGALEPGAFGLPVEAAAVVAHLTGYKGVGKKTAEQLVDAFGADGVFAVLETEPDRVREVLGAARGGKLLDAWAADRDERRAATAAQAKPPDTADAGEASAEPKKRGRRARGKRSGRGRKKPASA